MTWYGRVDVLFVSDEPAPEPLFRPLADRLSVFRLDSGLCGGVAQQDGTRRDPVLATPAGLWDDALCALAVPLFPSGLSPPWRGCFE